MLSLMTPGYVGLHIFYFDVLKSMADFYSKLTLDMYEYTSWPSCRQIHGQSSSPARHYVLKNITTTDQH